MSAEIKTELQIPDLWYDLFARLLPGIVFVGVWRIVIMDIPYTAIPSPSEIIILLLVGYIVGFIVQPISSIAIKLIQDSIARWRTKDPQFVQRITYKYGVDSYTGKILLKMHGEVAFFVQLATLSIVVIVGMVLADRFKCWVMGVPLLMLVLASMVSFRRVRRAQTDDSLNPNPSTIGKTNSA